MLDKQLIEALQDTTDRYWEQIDKTLLNGKDDRWIVQFIKYIELTDSCWLWTGAIGHNGASAFRYNGKTNKPVRIVYNLVNGNKPDEPVSKGMVIMHSCDNPLCVNPDHLSIGTRQDNAQDSIRKGRRPKTNPIKLSYELAEKIRAIYEAGGITQLELAKRYNVTLRNMQALIAKDIWKRPRWKDLYSKTKHLF